LVWIKNLNGEPVGARSATTTFGTTAECVIYVPGKIHINLNIYKSTNMMDKDKTEMRIKKVLFHFYSPFFCRLAIEGQ
jgi:hypothetical protein